MPALNVAVMIVGLTVAGLGLTVLVAPSLLLDFGRSLLTQNGLYAVAAVRVALGLLLLFGSRASRMPQTLRVIGGVVILAGLLTPLFGVTRSETMFSWVSAQGPAFVRVIALLAIAFGAFVVYAGTPRRSSAV
jgi:hypothetical protein